MLTKSDSQHVYCIILAGGSGTRFWPRSRQRKPKQLCRIGNADRTMLELTVERIAPWIPKERIVVVTNTLQAEETKAALNGKIAAVLAEPLAKNTAPALTLAAAWVDDHFQKTNGIGAKRPVLISLHADHIIQDRDAFLETLQSAVLAAEQEQLTLIGIKPTRPETGFGYIEQGSALEKVRGACKVASFVEKPPEAKARALVEGGKHYWNSGLFIWQTKTFVDAIAQHAPELHQFYLTLRETGFEKMTLVLKDLYPKLTSISVDHAILEKSKAIAFVPASFAWHDIGSWAALSECFPTDSAGNYLQGQVLAIESQNLTIDNSTNQLVAAIGLKDIVLVVEKDAILICRKEDTQRVKDIVTALKEKGQESLL